ncbi:MAG TPA: hypothetical protein VMI12_04845 [Puia sp.]|nr:hypothetical protein [Puia sp.]
MPENKQYFLIDHLDNNLSDEEILAAEELIRNDKDMANEWKLLHIAVDTIREVGLYEQVAAVRKQYQESKTAAMKPQGAVVRKMFSNKLRIAASILLFITAATLYKYTSVNSASFYNKYYSSFELNTSRGVENTNAMEQAFRNKNWSEVVLIFNKSAQKNNESYFLEGMAQMELKNYPTAINAFNQVMSENAKSKENYFQDESEYYLAMAYLANNEAGKAMPILEKIKADKNHIYHEKVLEISSLDFTIMKQKSRN